MANRAVHLVLAPPASVRHCLHFLVYNEVRHIDAAALLGFLQCSTLRKRPGLVGGRPLADDDKLVWVIHGPVQPVTGGAIILSYWAHSIEGRLKHLIISHVDLGDELRSHVASHLIRIVLYAVVIPSRYVDLGASVPAFRGTVTSGCCTPLVFPAGLLYLAGNARSMFRDG